MKTYTPTSPLCLALFIAVFVPLTAQTVSPSSSTAPANKTIVLEPFNVNTGTDVGYTAVDSLAGGRNNTPVRITPSSVSSLTSAFIEDLQLTDVRSALRWTLNVVPVSWSGGHGGGSDVFNSWSYNIRGAGTGPQGGNPPTVNYFPFWGVKDLFNVDRVEIDRGPNSILFGVGNLGGSVSTYTKIARLDQDSTTLNVQVNSYGGERFTADANRVSTLWDKDDFAIRVNLLQDHDQEWRKEDLTKKLAAAIATKLRLGKNTSVRLDLEAFTMTAPQFAQNLKDHFSQWDGVTNSPTWGAAPVGPVVTSNMAEWGGADHTQVWIPADGTFMSWGHGYKGAGLADSPYYRTAVLRPYAYTLLGTGQMMPALPSRDYTYGPKDGELNLKYYTATAYLDQRINDHAEFQLSAYRYDDKEVAKNFETMPDIYVDINKQRPDGSTNPYFGQKYSEMFLDRQLQANSANEFRGQFNYHFDTELFGVPIKEWISASAGAELHQLTTRQYIAQTSNGYDPNNWQQSMVWGRLYWDSPNLRINLPNQINGDALVYRALPFPWFDHDVSEQIKYYGLVSQTRFWNDRLNLTLGARHDSYYSKYQDIRGTGNVPKFEDDSGMTYSAGAVGYVTKWLGLVYNYSQNFAPIGGGVAPSLTGESFGAARGKSNSGGLRLSTEDGKYYVTATYYVDKAQGRISTDGVNMQGIWNDYLMAGGTSRDIGPAGKITGTGLSSHANMSYADSEDVKGDGFEFEATANPTPNLRLQLNYSVPKSVSTNNLVGSRAYFASHLADWRSVAIGGLQPYAGTLGGDLVTAQQKLNETAVEATNAGLIKSTLSAFAVYSFNGGWANGFSVGGGATSLGEQNIRTGGSMKSPGYTTWTALVGYQTKFGSYPTKIQLNVDNVFDNDTLVFTDFNTVGAQTQGSAYYFVAPRKFTLSITMKF